MTSSIWNWKLEDLLAKTASPEPTPGGGAVAVATGCLGIGLVIMALAVTGKRQNASANEIGKLISQVKERVKNLQPFADRDIEAFKNYMDALALPKDTAEQKQNRGQALHNAAMNASTVPLDAAREMLAALKLANNALTVIEGTIVSDVITGALLLNSSLQSVLYNVDLNLAALKDDRVRQQLAEQREQLASEAQLILQGIISQVQARMP